jgi:hypothetical protein
VEIKLKAAKEKMQTQLQLLDSTRKELCKREFSSSVVISSVVANAMALVNNHMPDFDAEICHTPFRDSGNEASIRVPRMFKSHV